jgi:hypothetical protein
MFPEISLHRLGRTNILEVVDFISFEQISSLKVYFVEE